MTEKPLVLVYNFKPDERTRLIRRYLNKEKISLRMVEVPEFWQPLGYLAGLSGFQKDTSFHLGGNFFEEMLVMCGLSPDQSDRFLRFFREEGLDPVALKAMITPVNQHWNSLKLYEELKREHQEMQKLS